MFKELFSLGNYRNLFVFLIGAFSLISCHNQESIHLRKSVIKEIYPGIVEVIVPKVEDEDITYERPLPFHLQDFKERNDKYHSIGTAFFISDKRLLSAAHVFDAENYSSHEKFFIRTFENKVFPIGKIYRYSTYRDLIEFDLDAYPENYHPLTLREKVEIGDMVYTVGNAQGEGISTRGGQVSTFTPEPIAGKWDFIRFSSPASPGNSGGPLVNSKGDVVGVIVMKNNSENLNYALPIKERTNSSTKEAHFFERQLKVRDGMQVKAEDWNHNVPLPAKLEDLRKVAAPAKNSFYQSLIEAFKKEFQAKLFPNNPRFKDSLLYQRLHPRITTVDKDNALHDWNLKPVELKKVIVSKDNIVYQAEGKIFNIYLLFKLIGEQKVDELLNNPRLLLNNAMKAGGAYRFMAGQRIPIVDTGNPDEVFDWRDKLGRPWKTSQWINHYNSSMITTHCTAAPEGVYCFIDETNVQQKLSGYMPFVKENILEVNISYSGTPSQWISYSKISKNLRPNIFENLKVDATNQELHLNNNNLSLTFPYQPKSSEDKNQEITALINYDPSKELTITDQGWRYLANKNSGLGFTLFKTFSVQELAPDWAIERWSEIKEKRASYNGEFHTLSNNIVKKIPLTKMSDESYLRGAEEVPIQAQWWLSCYGPTTSSRKVIQKQCDTALQKSKIHLERR